MRNRDSAAGARVGVAAAAAAEGLNTHVKTGGGLAAPPRDPRAAFAAGS